MSIFADAYSRYLSCNFNCINKQRELRKYFLNSIVYVTTPNFLSDHLINNYDSFPKYPYFFKVFARTNSIDLVKIYNSSMDDTQYLLDSFGTFSELSNKILYDSIPHLTDLFLSELNFQFSYISSLTNIFNYDSIIYSFISENQYRNFFSDLYSDLFYSSSQNPGETAGLENKSFLIQYFLYVVLFNILFSSTTISSKLNQYSTYVNEMLPVNDRVDSAKLISSFSDFINNYKSTISFDLAPVIGKSVYEYENISQKLLSGLSDVILTEIDDVNNGILYQFDKFINQNSSLSPINFLNIHFYQLLIAILSIDCICEIFDDETILNSENLNYYTTYESDKYSEYMSKMTEFTLKKYMFFGFLYKFWPIKFLNVLQLSIKNFVENEIKTPDVNLIERKDFLDIFQQFCNEKINSSTLANFLNTQFIPIEELIVYDTDVSAIFTFTPSSQIVTCSNIESFNSVNLHEFIYPSSVSKSFAKRIILKDVDTLSLILNDLYTGSTILTDSTAYKYDLTDNYIINVVEKFDIINFTCVMYYIYLLDNFFNSTEYKSFVDHLSNSIFIFLRDSGHIKHSFNWYKCNDIINIYLKMFFRWKTLDPSTRCIINNNRNASFQFINNTDTIKCNDKNSYMAVNVNDFIFSEKDSLEEASQITSKEKIGNIYFLNISPAYTGHTTTKSYESAYIYSSTDKVLFDELTNNFKNNIITPLLTNTTNLSDFDIDIPFLDGPAISDKILLFSSLSSFTNSLHQFSENMVLSSLTKETIYSILSEFIV